MKVHQLCTKYTKCTEFPESSFMGQNIMESRCSVCFFYLLYNSQFSSFSTPPPLYSWLHPRERDMSVRPFCSSVALQGSLGPLGVLGVLNIQHLTDTLSLILILNFQMMYICIYVYMYIFSNDVYM